MVSRIRKKAEAFIGQENLEFFRHSRNYLSGTVISNILVMASVPVLTHFLSPDEYGILSIFFSLVSMFVIAFGLNLNAGITRYYLEQRDDFDRMLGTNLIFIGAFSLILLAAVFALSGPLARLVGVSEDVFWFGALLAIVSVAVEIYMPWLNASQNSARYALLTVLRTGAALLVSIGLILWMREDRYLGRIWGELIVVGAMSLYAAFALSRLSRWGFQARYLRYALLFSLPLMPHTVSRFVLGYFDRIIILRLADETATGLYSFAYDIGMAMNLIVLATARAWRPIFFDEYREGNLARITRMARDYALNIYLLAFVMILFARDAVALFADDRYEESFVLIPVVILGYVFVFLYTLYFQYAAYGKRTGLISINTVIAGAANVGLNFWLIPIFGYGVAAYTSLVSFALLYALHYFNARVVLRAQVISPAVLLPGLALLAAMTAAVMVVDILLDSFALSLLAKLGMLALAAWHYTRSKRTAARG